MDTRTRTRSTLMGRISVYDIVDAFPEECGELLSRELRRVKKELKPFLDHIAEIQEDYIDDFEREMVALMVKLEYERYLEKEFGLYDHLLKIQKVYKIRKKRKVEGKPEKQTLDVERAKYFPIQDIYSFETKHTTRKNIYALCPFHSEKNGSFVIYTNNNNFHCFGCGVNGDSIDFVMKMYDLNFINAVQYLGG